MDTGLVLITAGLFLSGIAMIAAVCMGKKPTTARTLIFASLAMFLLSSIGMMAKLSFFVGHAFSPDERRLFLWGPGVAWLGYLFLFVAGFLSTIKAAGADAGVSKNLRILAAALNALAWMVWMTVFVYMMNLARLYQWDSLYGFARSGVGIGLGAGSMAVMLISHLVLLRWVDEPSS